MLTKGTFFHIIQMNASPLFMLMFSLYLIDSTGEGVFTSPSGYDPHLLDDPELTSGRHRKVLNLASYLVCMHHS